MSRIATVILVAALSGCSMAVEVSAPVADDCEPYEEECNGLDDDCDGVVDDFEVYCCSWSELYVGRCEDGRVVGCGWCLEPDGQPGLGPDSW